MKMAYERRCIFEGVPMIANRINILSEDQTVRLHEQALLLLRDTGMVIHNPQAWKLLSEYGAQVDAATGRVRFPERTVHEMIGMAPSFYTLGGRTVDQDLDLTLNSALTRPLAGCNKVFDAAIHRRRDPTTYDMCQAARLVDALPNLDCNAALIYGVEEPAPVRAVSYFKLLLENTQKHICMSPYGPRDVQYMIEMATVVQGNKSELARRPIFNIITSPASPLIFSEHFSAASMLAAEARVPVMMGSTPIAGGTGPVTLAGLVVLIHAENLAGLMLAQAANPGAPIYMGPRPSTMEMHAGGSLWGPIEWGIASSAAVQLARWCGLPSDFMGLTSDSKLPDQQSGIERAMLTLLAIETGVSLISGAGGLDSISTGSLGQLAIDDEIIAMARRAERGIEVDAEHIALDLTAALGPGGSYLGEPHTRKYYRKEHFLPALADRHSYGVWEKLGAKDMLQSAQARVEQILGQHEVAPLPESVSHELQHILEGAEHEMIYAGDD
jgi:trimethylamine--corrinoid protein Co-methyltransferase